MQRRSLQLHGIRSRGLQLVARSWRQRWLRRRQLQRPAAAQLRKHVMLQQRRSSKSIACSSSWASQRRRWVWRQGAGVKSVLSGSGMAYCQSGPLK